MGINEKPEVYDQIAAEESAKMEAALRAAVSLSDVSLFGVSLSGVSLSGVSSDVRHSSLIRHVVKNAYEPMKEELVM